MVLRSTAFVSLLFLPLSALCQDTSRPALQASASVQQHLVCNTGYSLQQCRLQLTVLKRVLDRYSADRLGDWTWVLVRSDDWKRVKAGIGLDPGSPAFTALVRRQTFIEEALVSPVPGRSAELIQHWSTSIDDLLTLAVTHELGHALCRETGGHQADAYGKLLWAGKELSCR